MKKTKLELKCGNCSYFDQEDEVEELGFCRYGSLVNLELPEAFLLAHEIKDPKKSYPMHSYEGKHCKTFLSKQAK